MSTTLEAVLTSIEAAITGLTPTVQPRRPFVNDGADGARLESESASEDRFRRFEVRFGKGSRGDVAVGPGEEEWVQAFMVWIVYPASENLRADELLIRQDADDLERLLADGGSWGNVQFQDVSEIDPPDLDEKSKTWLLTVVVNARFMKAAFPGGQPVPPELGNPATATIGAAAGVGAVITAQDLYEYGGSLTFTAGTGAAAGTLATINLPRSFQAMKLVLENGDDNALAADLREQCRPSVGNSPISSFDILYRPAGPPLTPGTSYTLTYVVGARSN